MNCSEIQERLSAFHDSELSPDVAEQVASHLSGCSTCAKAIASFEQLSALSHRLADPQAPSHLWEEIQSNLSDLASPKNSRSADQSFDHTETTLVRGKRLALAAMVLIAVGIGTIVYQSWLSDEHDHLAINFASYLEEFQKQPDIAQRMLLAKYDGQPITLAEASEKLGYEPVAAKGLPVGYSVSEVHLLKMPCCTCAQVLCTNKDGNSVAIFEHALDQPVWFGNRPSEKCLCHEVPTEVKQVGNQLAATWKEGDRFITIIGATDLEEVSNFVAQFKNSSSS